MFKIADDLLGQRFGRLTIIKRAENTKTKKTFWRAKCDCGNEHFASGANLKAGHVESCGCLFKELSKERSYKNIVRAKLSGESAFNELLSRYIRGAKSRGHLFLLNRQQFKDLVAQDCYYCGATPARTVFTEKRLNKNRYNGNFWYNGIDRKDNSLGYTTDNSLPCCLVCNHAKHQMTFDEYVLYLNNLVTFRKNL